MSNWGLYLRISVARKAIITTTLALTFVGGLAVPANAEEAPIPPDVLAELNENFDELGVAPEARDGLLERYANGETWDNSSGVEPVTTETYRIGVTDYSREVYADGSVSLTSVEMPLAPTTSGEIAALGISECSYSLSAGVAIWSNCKIEKNNGVLTMWFRAGLWRGPGTFGTSVTNDWDWDIQAAGGACSKEYLGNPTGTKSRLRAFCTVVTGIGSAYPYVDLDVGAMDAAVNANW